MNLTYSKLIRGFEEWFKANLKDLEEVYTDEAKSLFDNLEDFAVEIYLMIVD